VHDVVRNHVLSRAACLPHAKQHSSQANAGTDAKFKHARRFRLLTRQTAHPSLSLLLCACVRTRHSHYSGRPLYLDERRYGVLRDLYARHAVAAEVARLRSSGREVLITGYY
jgi:hypothetical protein